MALKDILGVAAGAATGPVGAIAMAIPGIAKGIGALFGGGKRRRRERRAKKEYNAQMSAFKNFQFENPYEDLENTFDGMENQFEDMRVATQAAEMQFQEQQQGLAQSLEALRGAGGGTGAAAIAQAMAQQQSKNQQQIAAGIEQQERQNELATAQAGMEMQRQQAQAGMDMQMAEAAGAQAVQQQEFDRTSTLLGMSQQELAGARQARAQATADLAGGLGAIGGAALGGAFKGVFGGGGKIPSALNASTSDILSGNFVKSAPTFSQLQSRPLPSIPQLNLSKHSGGNPFSRFLNN